MFDRIVSHLPKTGMLAKYMEYTSGGEICPRFRFFSIVAAVGAVLSRNVAIHRSRTVILYPSPWVILVAPQGVGHKSSALRGARWFLERLPLELRPRLLASKLTPEALVKSLASQVIAHDLAGENDIPSRARMRIVKRKAQGVLYSSEFGVLLGREKYNLGMIALLTNLYDCEDEWNSETIMRGDQRLYEICLAVMGASTPDWMQSMLPTDAFKGGFMSRLILVGFPEGWNKRVAEIPSGDEALQKEILSDLVELRKLTGQVTLSADAKVYFEKWYLGLPESEPGPKAAYLERKQDHILKLATILQTCEDRSLELSLDSVRGAQELLESIEPETLRMIDYISVEPRMRAVQRIVELLERESMTEADLLSEAWRYLSRPGEFDDIMSMLKRAKKIDSRVKNKELYYEIKK